MSLLPLDQLLSPSLLPCFQRGEENEKVNNAMYLSDKRRQIDFYKEGEQEMMIEVAGNGGLLQQQQQQMVLPESSGEDHEMKAPKKRAETWVQEETRNLISFRREMDGLFNTSKSNKHLWEQISAKMRDKGFDRSPTMCTDKWRNLLKEFKKAKHQTKGSGSSKMSYYKELDELLKERNNNGPSKSPTPSKVGSYLQFSEKGLEDAGIPFGSGDGYYLNPQFQYSRGFSVHAEIMKGLKEVIKTLEPDIRSQNLAMEQIEIFRYKQGSFSTENASTSFKTMQPASQRETLNLERRLDHDGHPLAITAADAVTANGVPPWNWRDTSPNDGDNHTSYGGSIIIVKWGEYTKKIGIDGTAEAIKEAIKSAFGLRTRRAFWLEDEYEVVRSLDRAMPLGAYTLHLDEGVTIKICVYDEGDRMTVRTEDKTLYTEDDFRDFLSRRGWAGLREFSGFRSVDTLDDLRPGAMYQGVRLLGGGL